MEACTSTPKTMRMPTKPMRKKIAVTTSSSDLSRFFVSFSECCSDLQTNIKKTNQPKQKTNEGEERRRKETFYECILPRWRRRVPAGRRNHRHCGRRWRRCSSQGPCPSVSLAVVQGEYEEAKEGEERQRGDGEEAERRVWWRVAVKRVILWNSPLLKIHCYPYPF